MAEPAKPITSETMNAPAARPVAQQTASQPITAEAAPARAEGDDDMVSVKPRRHFRENIHDPETAKTPDSEPYQVPRIRAVQLVANGLVEYVNDSDADHAAKAAGRAAADAVRRRNQPTEDIKQIRTSPLKATPVRMASASDDEVVK